MKHDIDRNCSATERLHSSQSCWMKHDIDRKVWDSPVAPDTHWLPWKGMHTSISFRQMADCERSFDAEACAQIDDDLVQRKSGIQLFLGRGVYFKIEMIFSVCDSLITGDRLMQVFKSRRTDCVNHLRSRLTYFWCLGV